MSMNEHERLQHALLPDRAGSNLGPSEEIEEHASDHSRSKDPNM